MLLAIGTRHLDLTHRAAVVGVLPLAVGSSADAMVALATGLARDGADVVEVDATGRSIGPGAVAAAVASVAAAVDRPVGVRADQAAAIGSAVAAGAEVVTTAVDQPPADHGSSEIAAVDVVADRTDLTEALGVIGRLAGAGRVAAASVVGSAGTHPASIVASLTLALAAGARAVRAEDVRTARRVVDVTARLLEARAATGGAR